MIRLTYEVDGRIYDDPSKAMDALTASLFQEVGKEVAEHLRAVKCPEHDEHPTVTVVGTSADQIDLRVSGCCDRLVEAAERAVE